MPNPSQISDNWWINDQTPDNPYGKSEDYESFLDYLGALPRSLTPEMAAGTLRINVYELNDHPEYKAAAIGALQMWASVTPPEIRGRRRHAVRQLNGLDGGRQPRTR